MGEFSPPSRREAAARSVVVDEVPLVLVQVINATACSAIDLLVTLIPGDWVRNLWVDPVTLIATFAKEVTGATADRAGNMLYPVGSSDKVLQAATVEKMGTLLSDMTEIPNPQQMLSTDCTLLA